MTNGDNDKGRRRLTRVIDGVTVTPDDARWWHGLTVRNAFGCRICGCRHVGQQGHGPPCACGGGS